MGLFGSGGERKRAGLFIFGGVMQYVELLKTGESYALESCIDMPYDVGSAGGELFTAQGIIENNLRALKREIGKKWPDRVYVGIQSKDVLLRTVELPQMDLRDIKNAFRYEFDRFFPIPVDDSVYDVSFIDRPAQDDATQGAVAFCLASAVRRPAVENLMLAAQRVGLKLSAIEPSPVAMLRCLMGPVAPMGYNVYALAGLVSSIRTAITGSCSETRRSRLRRWIPTTGRFRTSRGTFRRRSISRRRRCGDLRPTKSTSAGTARRLARRYGPAWRKS